MYETLNIPPAFVLNYILVDIIAEHSDLATKRRREDTILFVTLITGITNNSLAF